MLNRLFCAASQHRKALKILSVTAILAVIAVSLVFPSLVSAGPNGWMP
jgi:hypothetical protein